jgi:hypothetical protein
VEGDTLNQPGHFLGGWLAFRNGGIHVWGFILPWTLCLCSSPAAGKHLSNESTDNWVLNLACPRLEGRERLAALARRAILEIDDGARPVSRSEEGASTSLVCVSLRLISERMPVLLDGREFREILGAISGSLVIVTWTLPLRTLAVQPPKRHSAEILFRCAHATAGSRMLCPKRGLQSVTSFLHRQFGHSILPAKAPHERYIWGAAAPNPQNVGQERFISGQQASFSGQRQFDLSPFWG